MPDTVTVRFRFTPLAAGPFVFHCHQLFHEDAGMMRNVCAYPVGEDGSWCDQWFPRTGGRREGRLVPADWGDLRVGQPVVAWYTGPVAESDPGRATAGVVVIREGAG